MRTTQVLLRLEAAWGANHPCQLKRGRGSSRRYIPYNVFSVSIVLFTTTSSGPGSITTTSVAVGHDDGHPLHAVQVEGCW
jgi:hypothetical protein